MTDFLLDGGSSLRSGWSYATAGDFRRNGAATFDPAGAPDREYELWSIPSHASGAPEVVAACDIGSNKQHVSPGDVLISKINPRLNRTWVVGEKGGFAQIASTEWVVFPRSEGIDSHFLAALLSDFRIRNFLAANASGVGGSLTRARPALFDKIRIPIPPLNEQRRIVEKIEALFAEIDRGIESLRVAKRTIGLYRQSLLKSAFEGRLTADWRAQNSDKLESPNVLIARIRKERERRYIAAHNDWERAVAGWRKAGEKGRRPTKPERPANFSLNAKNRTDVAADASAEWLWLSLLNLGRVAGGLTKNQKRHALPRKAKYLRVANVYSNRLELDEIMEIGVTEDELRKTRLVAGDILFVEGNGSIEHIGRAAIWDGSRPEITHQNHLIRFSPNGLLSSRFALYFMMSPLGRKRITAQASSTSGLHTLSISKVKNLVIPVCSPAEQAEIVRILDARLEAAEILRADVDASLARAGALRQSILKKAFAGQLVPRDPDDEPAPALLARIRAESAKAPLRRRRTRVEA